MSVYYNENNRHAAQRIRDHIATGLVAPGFVDERSIEDIRPDELAGYTQCHFFAGIGIWSAALRAAGWPDDRPIWTGSCPCQPFSGAGKGLGFADKRHLWPAWFHLIEQCQPTAVLGEQVADEAGLLWLDLVSADMEAAGYPFGVADLCAASVGAPHRRQRLFWVADTARERLPGISGGEGAFGASVGGVKPDAGSLDHAIRDGWGTGRDNHGSYVGIVSDAASDPHRRIGNTRSPRLPDAKSHAVEGSRRRFQGRTVEQSSRPFWTDVDWLVCRDSKIRPVEPGTFPLAHGVAGRMETLRQYGNGIVLPLATEFIAAWMDVRA